MGLGSCGSRTAGRGDAALAAAAYGRKALTPPFPEDSLSPSPLVSALQLRLFDLHSTSPTTTPSTTVAVGLGWCNCELTGLHTSSRSHSSTACPLSIQLAALSWPFVTLPVVGERKLLPWIRPEAAMLCDKALIHFLLVGWWAASCGSVASSLFLHLEPHLSVASVACVASVREERRSWGLEWSHWRVPVHRL